MKHVLTLILAFCMTGVSFSQVNFTDNALSLKKDMPDIYSKIEKRALHYYTEPDIITVEINAQVAAFFEVVLLATEHGDDSKEMKVYIAIVSQYSETIDGEVVFDHIGIKNNYKFLMK